ncbi:MAG: polyphenol oxidase family protein [Gemmatimonadota bacterium]
MLRDATRPEGPPEDGPALRLREVPDRLGDLEVLSLAGWSPGGPGLVAGITRAPADYGLSTAGSGGSLAERYERLAGGLGFGRVAVARQVHGADVRAVSVPAGRGMWIAGEADGLASDGVGLLLAVTAADCVPVYLVDRESGALALLHAGWRGAAEGVLRRGLEALARLRGVHPSRCSVHFGPAICGSCYEVGPDVLARFGRRREGPGRLDLRAWLAREAVRLGVPGPHVSVSAWCTSCDRDQLHSHRASGGRAGRMAAFLGRRPV